MKVREQILYLCSFRHSNHVWKFGISCSLRTNAMSAAQTAVRHEAVRPASKGASITRKTCDKADADPEELTNKLFWGWERERQYESTLNDEYQHMKLELSTHQIGGSRARDSAPPSTLSCGAEVSIGLSCVNSNSCGRYCSGLFEWRDLRYSDPCLMSCWMQLSPHRIVGIASL